MEVAGSTPVIRSNETGPSGQFPLFLTISGRSLQQTLQKEMIEALAAGQIDAALQNLAEDAAGTATGEFVIVEAFRTGEFLGIAFAQGSQLLQPVNESLAILQADGTYDALFQKYFPVGR